MKKPTYYKRTPPTLVGLVFVLALLLVGCGTTSKMEMVPIEPGITMQLSKFDKIVVHDFVDHATVKTKASKREEKRAEMQRVTRDFADMIAEEIRIKGGFQSVTRDGIPDENTMIISGSISRYKEGRGVMRFLIGMGAGSAYFDAVVECSDGGTGEPIGSIIVDKNSWALGGGFAAGQSAQGFMRGAARSVANQLYELHARNEQADDSGQGGEPAQDDDLAVLKPAEETEST